MKVSKLRIENFRGVKFTDLLFPDHVVLIGDNKHPRKFQSSLWKMLEGLFIERMEGNEEIFTKL